MTAKNNEILIVDDSLNDTKLMTIALQEAGINNKIVHLKNGEEALNYIVPSDAKAKAETNNKIGIIILDIKMPKVNGIEVLRILKSNESTKWIPVVMFTSSKQEPDIKECYNLGANSFFVKPFEFKEFSEVIANIGHYWLSLNQLPEMN